jgi:hypothetical protein
MNKYQPHEDTYLDEILVSKTVFVQIGNYSYRSSFRFYDIKMCLLNRFCMVFAYYKLPLDDINGLHVIHASA